MTEFAIKAGQLLLSLSILITLHELGHFIPARLFKTRVNKFYLFFDFLFPLPNVLNFSLFKWKRGDTEYGLGWFPMGGYVQIDGMVDESMDTDKLKEEPKPWEFRSKPTWQRLIIMLGGVTVNLILGFLIYSMVLFVWGKERLPLTSLSQGVYVDSTLAAHGLHNGDVITGLADGKATYFEELGKEIVIHGARQVQVIRGGEAVTVVLPADVEKSLLAAGTKSLFAPIFPFEIDSAIAGGAAAAAGMAEGHRLVAINGQPILGYKEGMEAIASAAGTTIAVTTTRDGDTAAFDVAVSAEGKIGVALKPMTDFLETETYEYSLLEAIPAGVEETATILGNYVSSLSLLFSKEGASQIGGFGALGSMFSPTWHWQSFWSMTAFLSIILAFMNVLPIPALDGGHVLFLLFEMVTGRKPGDKFLERAQTVGMVILLGLLVYANGNDIVRWIWG